MGLSFINNGKYMTEFQVKRIVSFLINQVSIDKNIDNFLEFLYWNLENGNLYLKRKKGCEDMDKYERPTLCVITEKGDISFDSIISCSLTKEEEKLVNDFIRYLNINLAD